MPTPPAPYRKIGLLVLDESSRSFLVCEEHPQNVTSDYIMPGGQFTEATVEDCLRNEIREELGCEVDFATLDYIGAYKDVAASRPDREVHISLYRGALIGTPVPSTEVRALHRIGKGDTTDPRVSPIVRNKIIPDLISRGILR